MLEVVKQDHSVCTTTSRISLEDRSFDDFLLFVECQAVGVIEAMRARLLSLNLDS